MMMGILELGLASVPVIASIIGLWFKMNNLVIRQDMKISTLQSEIKEMKRHNEKQEERIDSKLDELLEKITTIQLHFMTCINFKTNK
jgi:uncharacterized membrane protein (DUF106 family)